MRDPAMWRSVRLGDVLEIKHGYAFQGQYFGETGSHIVLTPGNFNEQGGFKHKDGKEKWYSGPVPADYVLDEGDVIIAMTEQAEGLLGSSATVPTEGLYLHNQRLGLVRITKQEVLDLQYAAYLFNSEEVRQQIKASASGVKIRHTSPSRIAAVTVPLPPVRVQRRASGLLGAYDHMIDTCTRRIGVLDAIVQGLYSPLRPTLNTKRQQIQAATHGLRVQDSE